MRKRAFLAILMVVAIALTSGCSLVEKDAAVDAATPIIEVAGKTITKGEVQSAVTNTLNYQSYVYSMYGMSFDPTDAATIATAQDDVITQLIRTAVTEQKEAEYGSTDFTEDELTEMNAAVDSDFDSYAEQVKSSYFADSELTGEELDAAVATQMEQLGYTKEVLLNSEKTTKAEEKLKAEVVKDVTVGDDEVQTEYDTRVEAAKSSYADNLPQYLTDVNNGSTIYYHPAGYRYVKNLLVNLKAEDSTAISDLQSQVTAKQTELDTANTSLTALPEDAATDTEEQAASRTELTAQVSTLEGELADLNTQLDAAKETAYANIQPTVDEIKTKLDAGEDFDALMEQYGEDTGMQSEPAKTTGYLVCAGSTQWVTEFTDASMALAAVGDVSDATRSSFGVHFIKYVSDLAEGVVALDDVKDTISAELLSTKQDDLYTATLDQWVTDANAKIDKSKLAD